MREFFGFPKFPILKRNNCKNGSARPLRVKKQQRICESIGTLGDFYFLQVRCQSLLILYQKRLR